MTLLNVRPWGWTLLLACLTGLAGPASAPAFADAERMETLIHRLGADSQQDRNAARAELVQLGPRSVPALVKFLDDMSIGLRQKVARLIEQLNHRQWRKREEATAMLQEIGGDALDAVTKAAQTDNPEVRWRATQVAAAIRQKDPQEEQRRKRRYLAAVRLLSELGDRRAAATLVRELDSDADSVPNVAAFGLGRIGAPDSVPALVSRLNDKSWQLRIHAVWGLGRAKDRRALAPLKALADAESSGPYLRTRALGAMARIVGSTPTRAEALWFVSLLDDEAWEVRAGAAAALRDMAGKTNGYRYQAPKQERSAAIAVWKTWAGGLAEKAPKDGADK